MKRVRLKVYKVTSPANIALIKYMGKKNHELNIPANASLSWTTDQLVTRIEAEKSNKDSWAPLDGEYSIQLEKKSIDRYMNFWKYLKDQFNIKDSYLIRSNNNFPFGCGLASSASSFSCLVKLAQEISEENNISFQDMAKLSSQGSGSSCRSLLSGWVEWNDKGVYKATEIPYKNILHKVVILEKQEKKVSSSEAHKLIATSLLNEGRSLRAETRLVELKRALAEKKWKQAYQISWAEFKDMHALFETSSPSFTYITSECIAVLNLMTQCWEEMGDGPIVTMDAGPNVHLLFREDQAQLMDIIISQKLKGRHVL